MLYIKNSTQSQVVSIPKHGKLPEGAALYLELHNEVNNTVIGVALVDSSEARDAVAAHIELPTELVPGEYTYHLVNSNVDQEGTPHNQVMATGLAMVGGYATPEDGYNNTIEYEKNS